MKILVLNGSPRPQGNTAAMVQAFAEGARDAGHSVTVVEVCKKKIAGCLACEYCHTKGKGHCVQQDDMQQVYPLLEEAEMIVLASPIYYHGFTGQLQCAINRIYALDKPKHLKKAALIMSSGSDHVYCGAIYEYQILSELSETGGYGDLFRLRRSEQIRTKARGTAAVWPAAREYGRRSVR